MPAGLYSGSDAWSSAFLDASTLCLTDYQLLLGLVAQAVWETNANGQVIVDSPSWRAYTGQNLEDWLGEGWIGAIHPDDRVYALAQWQEAVQKRQPLNAEFRLRSHDGGWRWTNVKAMPVLNQDGSIQKWLGINIDISDKKQGQIAFNQQQQHYARELEVALQERTAQLQANQQLLQATLDASQDLIQVFQAVRDEQGAIIDFSWRLNNHAAEQFYGDVIGHGLLTANPGVVKTGIFDTFKRVVETGVPDQSERHYVHEQFDGWFYQSVVKLDDGVATTTADITARKQVQDVLRQKEERLQRVLSIRTVGVIYFDLAGGIHDANEAFQGMSGYGREAFLSGQVRWDELTPPEFIDATRIAQQEYRTKGVNIPYEKQYIRPDGSRWWGLFAGTRLSQEEYVEFVLDITRQKQNELDLQASQVRYKALAGELEQRVVERTQELLQANQDLTRSNANLQQFAYVASHDLQEPLRKIQSFSTLLSQHLDDRVDTTASDYLDRINKSGVRMSTLIRDLLSYSRIATRQQTFGPISLEAVVADVLETLSLEIEQREAQVEVDDLPIVNGDPSQLSQLFQNLLSNALKFTPAPQRPQVRVSYSHRQLTDLPPEVRPQRSAPFYHQISVSDQGVGFETKYLDRIFQVFQRLHGKNEFAGTGVGLAICQRVVENHGGGITASSAPGKGATFCVYLPA